MTLNDIKQIIIDNIKINENMSFYISKEKIDMDSIKDCMGNRIFENSTSEAGYLVFINLNIYANWAHKCEYWFIINHQVIKNNNCMWPPQLETSRIFL